MNLLFYQSLLFHLRDLVYLSVMIKTRLYLIQCDT